MSKRLLAVLATSATVAAVAITQAPGASAADLGSFNAPCTVSAGRVTHNINGTIGDTFTVTNLGTNTCNIANSNPGTLTWTTGNPASLAVGTPTTVTLMGGAAGFTVDYQNNGLLFMITAVPRNDTANTGSSTPADVLQQVGKPAGGCATINDPALDWAGVGAQGWGESWAQWANEGRGGAVCTRTLAYSDNTGAWFVRS